MAETELADVENSSPSSTSPISRHRGRAIAFWPAFGSALLVSYLVGQLPEVQDAPQDSMVGLGLVIVSAGFVFALAAGSLTLAAKLR